MTDRHVVRRAGLLACLALMLAASVAPATVLAGVPAAAVAGDPVPSVVTFRGRVLDADRRPVEGARVVVVPVDRLRRLAPRLPGTRTDAQGRFELAAPAVVRDTWGRLPERPQLPAVVALAPGGLEAVACDTEGAPVSGDLELPLRPAGSLTGRVVDEAGHPVVGARVLVRDADHAPRDGGRPAEVLHAALAATTDGDGRFTLGPMWPGAIELSVRASGRPPLPVASELEVGATRDLGELRLGPRRPEPPTAGRDAAPSTGDPATDDPEDLEVLIPADDPRWEAVGLFLDWHVAHRGEGRLPLRVRLQMPLDGRDLMGRRSEVPASVAARWRARGLDTTRDADAAVVEVSTRHTTEEVGTERWEVTGAYGGGWSHIDLDELELRRDADGTFTPLRFRYLQGCF